MRGSYPVLAPDLVIEISSPRDTRPQVARKAALYLQAGVQLMWVIWPDSITVEVWQPSSPSRSTTTLRNNDFLDGLHVIPGFQHPVSDIFID